MVKKLVNYYNELSSNRVGIKYFDKIEKNVDYAAFFYDTVRRGTVLLVSDAEGDIVEANIPFFKKTAL